jgi:hypothetical protein
LTLLVSVILVSAFQRLLLYEQAYGFSRLRTYTHVFIIWLGVLLFVLMILELTTKRSRFALAALLAALGFGVTLNLMNVDAFITHQNVLRAQAGNELDTAYLASLSPDAARVLWDFYQDAGLHAAVREEVGGVLACQAAFSSRPGSGELPWQSFNLARVNAVRLFQAHAPELAGYDARLNDYGAWVITVRGEERACVPEWWD